jgi:hypothetical protein
MPLSTGVGCSLHCAIGAEADPDSLVFAALLGMDDVD